MSDKEFQAILIAGPTASGKSAFALEQAKKHNGVIINADSMQVYKDLKILTARPSVEDEHKAPHRLYGFASGKQAYSVGQWLDDVRAVIEECEHDKQMPIIVGGTGLYFSALLKGLSPIPDIPDDIRYYWRQKANTQGGPALHAILAEKDEVMADRLRPSDPQRVVRALEVLEATGQSLADWQHVDGTPLLLEDKTQRYVISPERDRLYDRCNSRFDRMLQAGALEEVKTLLKAKLDPGLPLMRALGLRPLITYLQQKLTLEEAIISAQRDTRRYAKRQLTWLRRNMITWNWLKK